MLNQPSLLGNGPVPVMEERQPGASAEGSAGSLSSQSSFPRASASQRAQAQTQAQEQDGSVPAAFGVWQEEMNASLQALAEKSSTTKAVGHGKKLSSVWGRALDPNCTEEEPDSLFFVAWRDAAAREGRPASLDSENRVKAIVNTGSLRLPRNSESVRIIHPACGVRVERVRGFHGLLRPKVPGAIMRLFPLAIASANIRQRTGRASYCPADLAFQKNFTWVHFFCPFGWCNAVFCPLDLPDPSRAPLPIKLHYQ